MGLCTLQMGTTKGRKISLLRACNARGFERSHSHLFLLFPLSTKPFGEGTPKRKIVWRGFSSCPCLKMWEGEKGVGPSVKQSQQLLCPLGGSRDVLLAAALLPEMSSEKLASAWAGREQFPPRLLGSSLRCLTPSCQPSRSSSRRSEQARELLQGDLGVVWCKRPR